MVSLRTVVVSLVVSLGLGVHGAAQEPEDVQNHQHMDMHDMPAVPAWTWAADGNAFFGLNYQQRQFADFSAWESQNWFGVTAERGTGRRRLDLNVMMTLEPFTIENAGSPQLFQTGESYQQNPLVNHQHPHDLVMNLGVTYRIERPTFAYFFGGDVVGSPTLGPTPFMHRESARDNPQVPLTHHYLDSTHITPGVLRTGIERGAFTFEASAFRGEEPDENRLNIDRPRLNSWAGRIGWHRGPWSAQFSGGHLHEPEWFEPYDVTRLTASVGFDGAIARRPLAVTLAWGENRQAVVANGVSDGFLLEWDLRASNRITFYGRAEATEKELFGLGLHPKGFAHPHFYSHVDELVIGVLPDALTIAGGRLGVGADVTLYHMSPDLLPFWAGSHSYHVFVRVRPAVRSSATHRH